MNRVLVLVRVLGANAIRGVRQASTTSLLAVLTIAVVLVLYGGKTADLLVAEMAQGGGLITHKDLADYRSVWREPVQGSYRGHRVISMPPPFHIHEDDTSEVGPNGRPP